LDGYSYSPPSASIRMRSPVFEALHPVVEGERLNAMLLGVLVLPRARTVDDHAESVTSEIAVAQRKRAQRGMQLVAVDGPFDDAAVDD
jgi:hypothetical protein